MTTKKSYRRYSPEFKREAIKCACEEGVTDVASARSRVSVPASSGAGETSCTCGAKMRSLVKAEAVMMRSRDSSVNWQR